jgi:hypothetical protein
MNEQFFLETIHNKAVELNMNPLLLMSGIEGLYTFKEVPLNALNYEFLDSLILTIFALRIGDQFHTIAEQNLTSTNSDVRLSATNELMELSATDIQASANPFLQSFVSLINGKSIVRKYHEKALDVAALEVRKAQEAFGVTSIGTIILHICKTELNDTLNLFSLFNQ